MAGQSDLIKKAAEGALEEIKKCAPEEYTRLAAGTDIKDKILKAAEATAKETLLLAEEFAGQPNVIAERIAKHLPDDRVKLIQGGLNIPTFRIEIVKKDDGKHWLEFTRDGKEFLPADELVSRFDVDWGITLQYTSILIEAILLVMSAVGIPISLSAYVIKKTVNEAAASIRSKASSKLRLALDDFVGAWDAAASNPSKKAQALFDVIKESYSATGIIWNIIQSLCSNMEWYEWMETSAKVTAMIIAAINTDGARLIAEISLIILSAEDFAKKIANVTQLCDIKKAM